MRKALIIFGVIILAAGITVAAIRHNHPIITKYLDGTARIIGKPIPAIVYTDGHINDNIKVYKDPKYKNDYLLNLKEFDKYGMLKYIDINLDHSLVGRSICTANNCYDTIGGRLFQSDVGEHFIDFRNDQKGFNFDPKLTFSNTEIKLNMPPDWLKFDSVRIVLNRN